MSVTLHRRLPAASLALTLSLGFAAVAAPPDVATRIARVEQGLTPGVIVKGRPVPTTPLADRMRALNVPGVSMAVISGGTIEWAKGYGLMEAGTPAAVTPETLFQAASISKPVAALAAIRLVQQGRVTLDEPVNARLLGWKVPDNTFTQQAPVTLRRLLGHTAGLTVHGFGGYAAGTPVPAVAQILDGQPPANSAAVRVDTVPGTLWRYSGGGYTVAQQLLVDLTGKPFPPLMDELVLRPLGMRNSTYEQPLPEARRAAAASGHRRDGSVLPGRYHTYPEMAAAGLWTTPSDLARFLIGLQGFLSGSSALVPTPLVREMITGLSGGYGLGLSLQGVGAAASFGHGGSNEGFKCQMTAFVQGGRGAVVMTNGDQGGRLGGEILRAIAREYAWPLYQPREKAVVEVGRDRLAMLTGRYELRPGRVVTVILEGDALVIVDGTQRIPLFAESPLRFFEQVEDSEVEFVAGADGAVTHLLINGRLKAPRLAS